MYAHWRDNGKVEKVEEIVKYCSKPADTLAASDAELVWLYRQTQRLKICQPLGPFKSWMKGLKDERKKIARVHQGRGDGQLMRVRKGKRGGAEDDAADNDGNFIEDAEDTAGEDSDDAPTSETRERLGSAAGSTSNLVIGLTLPQWRHTPWAEPMIMVQDYEATTLHSESEDGAAIRMWQQQAREWWDDNWGPEPSEALRVARMALDAAMSPDDIREAAEAACYIVHTCSSTVREGHDDIPDGDEEVPPEELDEDAADFVALFEGGTVVRLRPHPPVDDDEIPFESPAVEAWREKLRAEIDASAVRLLERRASLAHAPGRSSEHVCRIAA
jgi:hypothetical protein